MQTGQKGGNKDSLEKTRTFAVDSNLVVIHGKAFQQIVKFAAFRTKYSNPQVITKARYSYFEILYRSEKRSSRVVHTRPFIKSHERTAYFCMIGTYDVPVMYWCIITWCSELKPGEQGNELVHSREKMPKLKLF